MVAFAIFVLLLPAVLLAIAIVSAVTEGRRSPYDFAIGRVLSNSLTVIGSAPLTVIGASFVANAPVSVAMQALPSAVREDWTILAAGGLLYCIVSLSLQLFMIRVALDILEGRLPDLGDALAMAGRRLLPGLGVVLLSSIGIGFGFVLLVVPGILLLLSWFVVLPVIVVEGGGVMDAFERSTELVRGMRWRLLILLIIAMVIALLAAIPGELLTKVVGIDGRWMIAAVDTLTGTLTGVLHFVGVAAVYHEVRTAKEGSGSHDLEAVFA